MEIKVYGPGCAKCVTVDKLVRDVVSQKSPDISVEKISDIREMMKAGILSTPAVVIDGVLKSSGRVPSKEEIESWIS
jgi:small redox-active disulfide protein 2